MSEDEIAHNSATRNERIPRTVVPAELLVKVERLRRARLERIRRDGPKREQQAREINDGSNFNINEWLGDIRSRAGAITVEIGHGYKPWIKGRTLPPHQLYIGVEAKINPYFLKHPLIPELDADEVIREIKETRPDEKIFFIKSNTGFDPELEEKDLDTDYNPASYLPDELADQVLVTNTFDDPRLHSHGRIEKLFKELARLVKPGGKIIIHEDSPITFSKEEIEQLGLRAKFVAFAELNPKEFEQLSEYYGLDSQTSQPTAAEYFLVVEKPE